MAIQHAYAVTNKAGGLAATAFTFDTGITTNRGFLNDGRMDKQFSAAAGLVASLQLDVDFGAAAQLNCIALLNHNFGGNCELAISAASDAGFTTGLFDARSSDLSLTGSAPRNKDHVVAFPATSRRYWRLNLTFAAHVLPKIGELFFGEATTISRTVIYGNVERQEYKNSRFESYTGETRGHFVAGPIRVKELPFEDLDPDERDELSGIWSATRGGITPMLWLEQYDETSMDAPAQDCIYGRLSDDVLGFTNFDFDRYNPSALTLRSLGREVGG